MTDLLPPKGVIRDWVQLHRDLSEAPEEAHLGTAIATLSAGVAWKAPLEWAGGSQEPCTVSVILEGMSATAKKTTTANIARRLVGSATHDMDEELKTIHVHMVSHTSGRGILELVAAKNEEQAREWDTGAPPGHLIVWDEFGSMLGDPGQQRKGGDWQGQIRTTLLQVTNGWHGGSKTGALKLPASRVAVSVLGTMTRVELEQRVDTGILQDGFLGRFMLLPQASEPRYLPRPPTMTSEQVRAREEIEDWLKALATRRMAFGDPFQLLTPAACDRRDQWYLGRRFELEDACAEDPTDQVAYAMLAAFGRLQATQMKLAMLQAVAELSPRELVTQTPEITPEHLDWAERIVDLSMQEMGDLARSGKPALADLYREKVAAYLKREGNERGEVTRKQLMHNCTLGYLDAKSRWAICLDLETEGTLLIRYERRPGPGKPTTWISLVAENDD